MISEPPNKRAYFEQVWQIARQIPEGRVATYGQLAKMVDPPTEIGPEDYKAYSPRWVGDAMAACPQDVPWHRVINSQGKISAKSHAVKQLRLLQQEGFVFDKDKLDLKKYQWGNPEPTREPEQTSLF